MTIRLDWVVNPSSEFVTSYQVWQSKDGSGMTMIGTTANNYYEIANPLPGVYNFTIKAVNIAGISVASDVGFGPGLPSKPATPDVSVV